MPPAAPPQPPKQSSALIWASLGCGGLMFVAGIIAVVGAMFWVQQRTEELDNQLAAASAALKNAQPQIVSQLSGNCQKAYDCCVAITSNAADAALAAQCETFKLKGRTELECAAALDSYVKVAKSRSLSCD